MIHTPATGSDTVTYLRELVATVGGSRHISDAGTRPMVTVAWAQSLDGSIATFRGTPTAISGTESLMITHTLRSMNDAILVGIGTVLSDDPQLTTRHVSGDSPRVVVLDRRARCPESARLFAPPRSVRERPIVCCGEDSAVPEELQRRAEVVPVPVDTDGLLHIPAVLAALAARGVRSVMVEGGGAVLASMLAADVADLVVTTVAPLVLGGFRPAFPAAGGRRGLSERFGSVRWFSVGDDVVMIAAGRAGARE